MKYIKYTVIFLLIFAMCMTVLPRGSSAVSSGSFSFSVNDGEITITGYIGVPTNIIIPAMMEGMPVTKIGSFAFSGSKNLTDITIPASVTTIGNDAFDGCDALRTVCYPEAKEQWEQIGIGPHNADLQKARKIFDYIPGDFDENRDVTDKDVIYLLWYTLFPENYSIWGNPDYNEDGSVSNEDVVYLLWHTLFPEEYPLWDTEAMTPEQILQNRRDTVEAMMRYMMSVLWTPAEDITYSKSGNSLGVEADREADPSNVITLYAGNIYQGIPYTHGSGSGYSFLDYATGLDEDGIYTLDGIETDSLSGHPKTEIYNTARIGNNCVDAIFWAWGQVSSTITFTGCKHLTASYGCPKVGDYEFNDTKYNTHTKYVCQDNGEQRMFEAYALMQKGDTFIMVNNNGVGHGVMNVSVHVVRDENGQIDGDKSYAVILEQTSSCEVNMTSYYNEELGQTVYLCEELDKHWSFNSLYAKGYLPVTCKELIDPSPLAEPVVTDYIKEPSVDNMFTGKIAASYRIASVTISIRDTQGKVVQEATCFGSQYEMYEFSLSRFENELEQTVMLGELDIAALDEGNYSCSYTCRLSTGDVIEFRNFDFSV